MGLLIFFFGVLLLNALFAMASLLSIGMHLAFSSIDQSLHFLELFHFLFQLILLSIAGEYIDNTTFCDTHKKLQIEVNSKRLDQEFKKS
jgi:hypothetical protein